MKTTSERLKEGMKIRGYKQVDIIEKTGINKGALSSYLSGKYEPKQNNIYKLAKALNVNEAWLMGHDVPMERKNTSNYKLSDKENTLLSAFNRLNSTGQTEAIKRVNELTYINKYTNEYLYMVAETPGEHKVSEHLMLNAAHRLPNATEEDIQHDDDIMDDPNF